MLRAVFLSILLAVGLDLAQAAESPVARAPGAAETVSGRESELAKAVEKQERRHYEMHRFYIPLTQGNLQWLAATVGAKTEEAALVWKLMRSYDGARWTSMAAKNPG